MGVKREGGLLLKLLSTERRAYLREGALIEDLRCYHYWVFCLSDVKKKH